MGKFFKVKFRPDKPTRSNTTLVEGQVYEFKFGWNIGDEHHWFPGESAWVPVSFYYPKNNNSPKWIASGDLIAVDEKGNPITPTVLSLSIDAHSVGGK